MNVTEARNALYALVKRAEEDGCTTLICKGQKRQDRVLLAPLDLLPAARKAEVLPSHVLSAAQRDFGDLITRAAQGRPQVLLRNTTPVAVLLPADAAFAAHSSGPTAATGVVSVGGVVNGQGNLDRGGTPRRLATLGDAIGAVLASGQAVGPVRVVRAGRGGGWSAAGSADAGGGCPERGWESAGVGRCTAGRAR
ncbi:type II toxin-antitoxin system prevent-host-death family antitoxin [Streptomyces sp. NPDC086782]|uniref:type II toxin-antitoxin system prevent-host-death family antitoxin n=1 Tax=Streptomyces sp. NPDC086782 TaxID=3365757 RepID=UPI00381DD924